MNCWKCATSVKICTECGPLTGLVHDGYNIYECAPCQSVNCNSCRANFRKCTGCYWSFPVINDFCHVYHENCMSLVPFTYICDACHPGFRVVADQCAACSDPGCEDCSVSAFTCLKCKYDKSLVGTSCVSTCNDPLCTTCPQGSAICEACKDGYGIVSATNKTCDVCMNPNCLQCPYNRAKCRLCGDGFGVKFDLTCGTCKQQFCTKCPQDEHYCTECSLGYGPENGVCKACNIYCAKCSANRTIC